MAIQLEFIDLVVPRSVIEAMYPGGWDGCLSDHRSLIGGRVWFDEYLFRDGAMNPTDIKALVERWERLGLQFQKTLDDGTVAWNDLCVVEGMFRGATLPCDWLEVDTSARVAYLAGTEPGNVAGREDDS